MTVTQSYSLSLTYTSLRMYTSQTVPATALSTQSAPPAAHGDTVTLSPEASAQPAVEETPTAAQSKQTASGTPAPPAAQVPASPAAEPDAPAANAPAAPTSRAARRADALLDRLDVDRDGAITKEEFVDGAMALLRRGGTRHHDHHVHGEGHERHGHEGHRAARLERRLDRLFERVDASGDGNVDQAELTDALAKVTRERRPDTAATPAPPAMQGSQPPSTVSEPHTPPAAAMSYTSVTVVIAVKQYTSIAAMNA